MKKILTNYFYLITGECLARAINFFSIVYVARKISVIGFGKLSFAQCIVSYGLLLVSFGLDYIAIRDVSKNNANESKYVGNIIMLRAFLFFLAYLSLVIMSLCFNKSNNTKSVMLIYGLIMAAYVFDLSWLFQAKARMDLVSIIKISSSILYLLIIITAPKLTPEFVAFMLFLSTFSVFIVGFFIYKMHNNFTFSFDKRFFKYLIKESSDMCAVLFMSTISFGLPMIIISFLKTQTDVGLYASAYKILQLAVIPNAFLYQSFAPELVRNGMQLRIFRPYLYSNLIVGVSISLVVFMFAPIIISILYGDSYLGSVSILRNMSFVILVSSLLSIFASPLVLFGYQRYHMILRIIGVIFLFLVSYLIIPGNSISYAVFASVIADFLVAFLAFIGMINIWKRRQKNSLKYKEECSL